MEGRTCSLHAEKHQYTPCISIAAKAQEEHEGTALRAPTLALALLPKYHQPMPRIPTLLILMLLSACGGEAGGGGGPDGASTSSGTKKEKEKMVEDGYCVNTFQVQLLDQSGRAQVRACLVTNEETRKYILKHDDFAEKIRQNFIKIVGKNSLGELEMPDSESRVRLEMLESVQKQIKPLVVNDVVLQRWELW